MSDLKQYFSIAEAISLLLRPHGEVIVHDLRAGKIAAIYNNFSKRKVGDDSLVEELGDTAQFPDVFPVYEKTNWDGRKLKSSSAAIRDKQGNLIGLFCINLDLSQWEEFRHFLDSWLKNETQPAILFQDDWREKINSFVGNYLKKEGLSFKALTKENKMDIIHSLHREGAFKAKNAASYVADVLNLSRATVYNYLRNANADSTV